MSIFQQVILKRYINRESEKIKIAYRLFTPYFLNTDIQENIRTSKEEQFQRGFLRELFVNVLGYTLHPNSNYNLITEQKNEKDAKKADAAILVNNEVVGVIELKDHKTIDLKQVETQAFGYMNNNRKASYVVTSNFEKLRFYIGNAIDFIEFNLFTLSYDDFAVLWMCLAYENIAQDLPKQMKAESVGSEDQITKQLYKDYSTFKRELFADLIANNPKFDQLTLFKKSQKLLDRLLFILFAEDGGLLPANSIAQIVEQWEKLKDLDAYSPLYERLKKYFGYMNTGHKGKHHDIFAYNGGLFQSDDVLDNVLISDELLHKHTLHLSQYNFASEVDVNILGHIFENSLTEIEEITKSISSQEDTPQTSKRKKDGVFYTPRYITAYIVENTLGKLCVDKKIELEIKEAEYFVDKKRNVTTKKPLDNKLKVYREWLLSLTICDPACGSGAFLNAALDYLMIEHRLVDEMYAKIHGVPMVFPDVENAILENNLYGVDINEESVEIAKLALWLRTAKPQRKLNSLNDNIKCGNSLISDPNVAGNKAFDWHKEFPKVFAKGGFDAVIGNPPYVFARENVIPIEKEYYVQNYESAKYQINTYILFIEKSFRLLKQKCQCGLIIPNAWLMIYSGEDLRKYLMQYSSLDKIVNLMGKSFEDANVETVILIAKNTPYHEDNLIEILSNDEILNSFTLQYTKKQNDFIANKGLEFNIFSDDNSVRLINKLNNNSKGLDVLCSVKAGLQAYEKGKGTPEQSAQDVNERPYDFDHQYNSETYKYLDGSNVSRYSIYWSGMWLWYGSHLAAPRTFDLFSDEKIIIREITGKYPKCIIATYSDQTYLYNRSNIAVVKREGCNISLKYITTIINSSLMSYYFVKNTAKAKRKLFPKIILNDLRLFPIKEISCEAQQPFIDLADNMLTLNTELQTKRQRFHKRLADNIEGIKITRALEQFDTLEFKEFVKELAKQKIKLSLSQQDEWEEYFTPYKTECSTLVAQINTTDQEIDRMVYELYGLTEEEIGIVEGE